MDVDKNLYEYSKTLDELSRSRKVALLRKADYLGAILGMASRSEGWMTKAQIERFNELVALDCDIRCGEYK